MWVARMDDRNPDQGRAGGNRPDNIGAGPGTGDPRPDYPGGSPVDVRDGTLRRHSPLNGADARGGEPIPGLSAEAAARNANRSTVTPSVTEGGWSAGGMAIPALLIVVLILALAAWLL